MGVIKETKPIEIQSGDNEKLIIESITLLDGVTPDESVQYKVGREVAKLVGAGIGSSFFVFYDEKRAWRTYTVNSIEVSEEKVILQDKISIYTFEKRKIN